MHTLRIDWGDGSPLQIEMLPRGARTFSFTHRYLDDPSGTPQDTVTIAVNVADDDSGEDMGDTATTVRNVVPVIDALASSAPSAAPAEPGELVTVSGSFSDVGSLDTHTGTVHWGDGTTSSVRIDQAGGTFTADHAYTTAGIFEVNVFLSDDDGGETEAATTAIVTGVAIVDHVLYAVGTESRDQIHVRLLGGKLEVQASFLGRPGKQAFNLDDVQSLHLLGCGDDDVVTVDPRATLPAILDGGDGNDRLIAGGGDTVLLGGPGDDVLVGGAGSDLLDGGPGADVLTGGPGHDILVGGDGDDHLNGDQGRDLLIGGDGGDRLEGGPDDDLLIAARGAFDDNQAALSDILAEWTADRDYETRTANLRDGSGSTQRANASIFLNQSTVFDDGDDDQLTGASGRDWFFANLDGLGALDAINGLGGDELVEELAEMP